MHEDLSQDELWDDPWDDEVAAGYDTPGEGMFSAEVLGPTVDRLAALADGGRALELAVGTGRVAVPLLDRGVPVAGIERSPAMVARLRAKADAERLPVVVGDMTTARVPGEFALVYLVFNTISNLVTQDAQVECFRNAARHLAPGGRFVVELGVPDLRRLHPRTDAVVFTAQPDYLGVDTHDVVNQLMASHHVRTTGRRTATWFRGRFRYAWPAELDLMARIAGFALESRHADWQGTRFGAESTSHVSTYRLPTR